MVILTTECLCGVLQSWLCSNRQLKFEPIFPPQRLPSSGLRAHAARLTDQSQEFLVLELHEGLVEYSRQRLGLEQRLLQRYFRPLPRYGRFLFLEELEGF